MEKEFGKLSDGRQAHLFVLRNDQGLEAAVTDMGATLVQLKMNDKNGVCRDLVLGHDDAQAYEFGGGSIGATVGRVANRIGQGRFMIGGKEYHLLTNNGPNTLHGGKDFYTKRLWDVKEATENAVTFSLESPDGDQGFPGNLSVTVTYSVTDENELVIEYGAVCDQDTPFNPTNHSYFNLAGHDSGSAMSQIVTIYADCITENDENSLPTGAFLPVEGTPMDFREPRTVGSQIDEEYDQLTYGSGYDHNYVIRGTGYRKAAEMTCEETGITMTVFTDLPGIQFYSANHLHDAPGKEGAVYQPRQAVCFESQYYPDAINQEHFPGGLLKKGDRFVSRTAYQFSL